MSSTQRKRVLSQARVNALSGEPSRSGLADHPNRKMREDWAYIGSKTVAQYRSRLTLEDDPFILGELIERAAGTSLSTTADLIRAVEVGGRARMHAALDPRCPPELVQEWVRDWLAGQVNTGPLDARWVMNTLPYRHPFAWSLLIPGADYALYHAHDWHRGTPVTDYDKALCNPWDLPAASATLAVLATVPADRHASAGLALRRSGLVQFVADAGLDLSAVPVPVLRTWFIHPAELPTLVSADAQVNSVISGLWGSFSGTAGQLADVARESLLVQP